MGNSMKTYNKVLALTTVLLLLISGSSIAQNRKLAQTGLKFLSVSTDARISAMGEAITSVHMGSSAMLYNPAGMAEIDKMVDVSFGQTGWIADINYMHATAAFQPFDFNYGIFGVSLMMVDYGDLQGTIRANNDQGYLDVGTFNPKGFVLGFGYAKALSNKFSIGGNIKYVKQSMGTAIIELTRTGVNDQEFETDAIAFDFGVIYKTGFKSLNIGMSIRNFAQEIKYIEEQFQLPLTFRIGLSMDVFDLTDFDKDTHSLLVSVDASHPRDFEEQAFIGAEYVFMNTFSVRGGYSFPHDERGLAAGVGVKQEFAGFNLAVDYGYEPFGVFDDVHRITINMAY